MRGSAWMALRTRDSREYDRDKKRRYRRWTCRGKSKRRWSWMKKCAVSSAVCRCRCFAGGISSGLAWIKEGSSLLIKTTMLTPADSAQPHPSNPRKTFVNSLLLMSGATNSSPISSRNRAHSQSMIRCGSGIYMIMRITRLNRRWWGREALLMRLKEVIHSV